MCYNNRLLQLNLLFYIVDTKTHFLAHMHIEPLLFLSTATKEAKRWLIGAHVHLNVSF